MRIQNLNQRTKLWYQHRKKYINASEVASITGLDPFRSMEQLVHDKLFGTTFTANQYNLLHPSYKVPFGDLGGF
ncbi:MAG: endonuclease [Candidatus Phytoplasma asteris]|uniref:Endonuclease n=2 Tax=16SrI (Aster yellows group) TaxID=3042590 RepID=Q6YRG5_ONYPE|nr:MAG: endonuclease [Periwinkle leaf yellowing phytoplasma]WEX19364.1 MAG: endonuclease [Candidatus Phytoplasma asteris]BAD04135.1 conserved hypothetical protein [Onion yellows phytoplasma OY-M]